MKTHDVHREYHTVPRLHVTQQSSARIEFRTQRTRTCSSVLTVWSAYVRNQRGERKPGSCINTTLQLCWSGAETVHLHSLEGEGNAVDIRVECFRGYHGQHGALDRVWRFLHECNDHDLAEYYSQNDVIVPSASEVLVAVKSTLLHSSSSKSHMTAMPTFPVHSRENRQVSPSSLDVTPTTPESISAKS